MILQYFLEPSEKFLKGALTHCAVHCVTDIGLVGIQSIVSLAVLALQRFMMVTRDKQV